MERAQTWVKRAAFVLFIAIYALIFLQTLFNNGAQLNAALLFVLIAVACVLLYDLHRLLGKVTETQGRVILILFIAVSAAVQIIAGLQLRYIPQWDIAAVFNGGRDWAINGNFDVYQEYHAMQSNNHGALFLFRCVFQVYHLFGGTDFYAAALVFTVLILQVAVYAGYDAARRLAGIRGAVMFLALLAVYLPFYTMGAAFYTDTLSLPFVILVLDFYLRGRDAERFGWKLCCFVACGAFAAIGAAIKFTALIPLIAVALDWALNHTPWNWSSLKKPLLSLGAAACAAVFLTLVFSAYMKTQVDQTLAEQRKMPLSHWVMMGLDGSNHGRYSASDFDFSMGLPDPDTRRQEISKVIRQRIQDFGVVGLIKHISVKLAIDYESGTFNQADFFWLDPQEETGLHDFVLYNGKHYSAYNYVVTALLMAYLLLALAGAVASVRKPNFCAPWLALLGLAVFLMAWETNNRYTLNHFPLIVLCAVMGLSALSIEHKEKGRSR